MFSKFPRWSSQLLILSNNKQPSNESIHSRLRFNDYFAPRYDNIVQFSSPLRILRFNNIMITIIKASERTGRAIFHRLLLQHDKLRNIIPPSWMHVMNITIIYNNMIQQVCVSALALFFVTDSITQCAKAGKLAKIINQS